MLLIGVVVVVASLLTFGAMVPIFQAPEPPRWTRSRFAGELVTLTLVAGVALGLALLGAGVYRAYQTGPSLIELGAVAITLGLAVVLWQRIGRPVAPAASPLSTVTERVEPAPQEPTPPRPVHPTRRAA